MSEREKVQQEIYNFLEENADYFDAPYGIIEGMQPYGRGKVRTIAFGVSRYLDGVISILTPNNISVSCQGGLDYKFQGEYNSADELISKFSKEI